MRTGRIDRPSARKLAGDGVALCVIGRCENRYAREFVRHYRRIGFCKVYLCDNNRDGEEKFEDALSDYIEDGFVEVLDYRNRIGVQRKCYEDVYKKFGGKHAWMAFFDFDEFFTMTSCDDVGQLMKNYSEYDCVLFNWQNYGDNELLMDDGRDLQERFVEPLPFGHVAQYPNMPDNYHAKCVVRGGLELVEFEGNPHVPSNTLSCCNSSGEPCKQSPFQKYDFSVAFLKHYATKTVEEWYSNKWRKGTGNNERRAYFKCNYGWRFFTYNIWTQEKENVMRECLGIGKRVEPKNKTVVIVNFNTTALTVAAIRSLNKCTPGCKVVVFDNSDKEPFSCYGIEQVFDVEVIDNTKGVQIDFDEMLSEYPDKRPTPENNYGSAKHCLTIDYCLDLFPDGFLLMDSDVLVKKDVSLFFDASCAWVGKTEMSVNRGNCPIPRVLPYLCYINSPMLRKHGVRYFNGDKMWALNQRTPDTWYDTGCWFYEACEGLPANNVNIDGYIIHLHHGSWNVADASSWLEENRKLWE